jgi:transposase
LDEGGNGNRGRPHSGCSEATGKTYVKLVEGLQHWPLYNQEDLFAVPHEELRLIEYKHYPDYLYRN